MSSSSNKVHGILSFDCSVKLAMQEKGTSAIVLFFINLFLLNERKTSYGSKRGDMTFMTTNNCYKRFLHCGCKPIYTILSIS